MNSHNIVHRDLKLDNILIHFPSQDSKKQVGSKFLKHFNCEEDEIQVIIGDLGFSKKLQEQEMIKSHIGTPLHMAPQVMFGQSYDNSADMWSLGTIVYELLVGFPPFTGLDKKSLAKNIKKGIYKFPKHV